MKSPLRKALIVWAPCAALFLAGTSAMAQAPQLSPGIIARDDVVPVVPRSAPLPKPAPRPQLQQSRPETHAIGTAQPRSGTQRVRPNEARSVPRLPPQLDPIPTTPPALDAQRAFDQRRRLQSDLRELDQLNRLGQADIRDRRQERALRGDLQRLDRSLGR